MFVYHQTTLNNWFDQKGLAVATEVTESTFRSC